MNSSPRTDLALESARLFRKNSPDSSSVPGIISRESRKNGIPVTAVEILDEQGEQALGKPRGRYITLELDKLLRREEDAFSRTVCTLAGELEQALNLPDNSSVLVVGLGNRDITPDAIGPCTLDNLMVTRHLRAQLPEYFGHFRPVSALRAGVLGTTGVESAALVSALVREIQPAAVVAVDALAAHGLEHLCRTVQIADTGIVPGSGVGNSRKALNRETLGVPVIAVGIPTVVDAAAFSDDSGCRGMIVTPRDIDKNVKDIAKLVGYALNLALHKGLSIEDVDMFLS